MCNLAGYAGNRRAAPILLEMLRKQEGFDAGYFTGIATVHEGKLHWRKVVGDVSELIKQTDAMDLPGTIGIIQGRSRCGDYGGDHNWAHPFINPKGNMAYAANGIMSRLFKHVTDLGGQAKRLYEKGYRFPTSTDNELLYFYPSYAPGCHVHTSEIKCFLIDEQMQLGYSDAQAMERVFCDNPGEWTGLMLNAENPDSITVGKVNFPMWIGHGDGEMFLASAPMVIDNDSASQIYSLPTNSIIEVARDNIQIHPFKKPFTKINDKLPKEKIFEAVVNALREGPKSFYPMGAACKGLWETDIPYTRGVVYEVLKVLQDRGCIAIDIEQWPGAGSAPHLTRGTFMVRLIKEP